MGFYVNSNSLTQRERGDQGQYMCFFEDLILKRDFNLILNYMSKPVSRIF